MGSATTPTMLTVQASASVRGTEGAGTTTLTSLDNKWQVFNLSAARTVLLPTTNIRAGDVVQLDNISTAFDLSVQSSAGTAFTTANGASSVGIIRSGFMSFLAKVDSPTTPAHWYVTAAHGSGTFSSTVVNGNWNTTPASISFGWVRSFNRIVMATTQFAANAASANRSFTFVLPFSMDAGLPAGGNITAQAGLGHGIVTGISTTTGGVNAGGDGTNEGWVVSFYFGMI